jgi:hypothetical protein
MMNPWFETIGVVLVGLFGIFLGRLFSRFRGPYWMAGYFLSLLVIAALLASRCIGSLGFMGYFAWVNAGRAKFVVLCLAATVGITTPLSRLPRKSEKIIVCVLMVVVVLWFSVCPFLVPALIKGHLLSLRTRIDSTGVCYQTTNYTCGPAAAVTALRQLGLTAEEGEIAVLSRTSPVAGTLPWCLYTALRDRYGAEGLKCQYRQFDSIGQLKEVAVTLAVVKDVFLSDHCVAVLDVSDAMVTVADPVGGRKLLSHEQFEKMWRFSGIALHRDLGHSVLD